MHQRRYSVILGNLGNTRDRFCHGYKDNPETLEMLHQAAAIPGITGVELVAAWDIGAGGAKDMASSLADSRLDVVSVIPDLYADRAFWKGAFTSRDPQIRQRAMDSTRQACDLANELGCNLINIWPGQDGYDYLLTTDYAEEREWACTAVRELATEYPQLQFALEYKPKEPRTHSHLARMADTLLLCLEAGRENVGVTIDTGHAFVGGEVVAEAIVLAERAGGRLMHMHFNDNHACWDDDMIVGSVHSVAFIEMLYWLDRCNYSGWLSMDQYPYREDAAGAIGESIQWLIRFDEIQRENSEQIADLLRQDDAVATSSFLRSVLA